MEGTFTIVIFAAVALFIVIGLIATLSGRAYDQIGGGGPTTGDRSVSISDEPAPDSASARADREQEIRQMLTARSERLVRRGGDPLDIDAEIARLVGPSPGGEGDEPIHDAALLAEVRQLVVARNERRVRRGEDPLDVDAEVDRTLRELDP